MVEQRRRPVGVVERVGVCVRAWRNPLAAFREARRPTPALSNTPRVIIGPDESVARRSPGGIARGGPPDSRVPGRSRLRGRGEAAPVRPFDRVPAAGAGDGERAVPGPRAGGHAANARIAVAADRRRLAGSRGPDRRLPLLRAGLLLADARLPGARNRRADHGRAELRRRPDRRRADDHRRGRAGDPGGAAELLAGQRARPVRHQPHPPQRTALHRSGLPPPAVDRRRLRERMGEEARAARSDSDRGPRPGRDRLARAHRPAARERSPRRDDRARLSDRRVRVGRRHDHRGTPALRARERRARRKDTTGCWRSRAPRTGRR